MLRAVLSSAPLNVPSSALTLFATRAFIGLTMAFVHGFGKIPPAEKFILGVQEMGFPFPAFFAWTASLTEFLGGILLALGLFTRPASLFLLITMLVAAFVRLGPAPFERKELALLYAGAFLIFLVVGPGRFSLDGLLFDRKKEFKAN